MHKIILARENKNIDITNYCGSVNLSDSVDSLGASFKFSVARNYSDSNFKIVEDIEVGNIIKFQNEKLLFIGVIIDCEKGKKYKTFNCLDFYFYLNQNKIVKQFNKINASTAISQLLQEVGASIGEVQQIATSITKIYKNVTIAEIIADILKQVNDELGIKYSLEINQGKFNLIKYKEIKLKAKLGVYGVPTVNQSISNMKNKITVISNDQEEIGIFTTVKDSESIKKYGQLQDIIQVDPDKDDISKIRNIASNKLKELNKVLTSATIDVLGDDNLRAGRLLEVNIKEFDLKGYYLIKSCSHDYFKGNHTTSLQLEVI